jgi:hypothetical protein
VLNQLIDKKINGLFIEESKEVSRIKTNLISKNCEVNGENSNPYN